MLAKAPLGVKATGATGLEDPLRPRVRKINPDIVAVIASADGEREGGCHLSGVGDIPRAEIVPPLDESNASELAHAALFQACGVPRMAPSGPSPFVRVGGVRTPHAISGSLPPDIAMKG